MRNKYEIEFKKQAVGLAERLGNIKKAAIQLGISDANIHMWKQKYGKPTHQGNSSIELSEKEELKQLRRENAELKKVNHILKSAAAFFSQDHLK